MIIFGIYNGAVSVHVTELSIASSGCFLIVLPNGQTWLYRWVPFQIEVKYITNQHQYQSIDFIVASVIVLSCQQNCVDNPNHILQ